MVARNEAWYVPVNLTRLGQLIINAVGLASDLLTLFSGNVLANEVVWGLRYPTSIATIVVHLNVL